jgi:hypothetical protein
MANDLCVVVVAHASREEMAMTLKDKVNADAVFMDDGSLGEWKNHELAWKFAQKSKKSHAVILQDDAMPVDNFRKHVLDAVEQKPHALISLYVGTHRPRKEQVEKAVEQADKIKASWLMADTLMWGVGVVVPTALIPEIFSTVRLSKLPYDQRVGRWAELTKNNVYYTWPSLVDHADEPTVVKGRSKQRQGARVAHKVGVPEWDGATLWIPRPNDWIFESNKT